MILLNEIESPAPAINKYHLRHFAEAFIGVKGLAQAPSGGILGVVVA